MVEMNQGGSEWVLEAPDEAMGQASLNPTELLGEVLHTHGYMGTALAQLTASVKSNEIRDYGEDFTSETYSLLFELLTHAWRDGRAELVTQVEQVVWYILTMPEFNKEKAQAAVTEDVLRIVLSRYQSAPESEHRFLRELLHLLYSTYPQHRPLLRALMGRFLTMFERMWKKDMAVAPLLEVMGQVIRGFRTPLSDVHRELLTQILLPLHKNNEMYEWRDQLPLLQLYHEQLVFCLVQYVEKERSLAVPIVDAVLRAWPEGSQSNTPKEVLCLHEIETMGRYLSDADFGKVLPTLVPRLARCLDSDHSRLLEKVLTLWKDPAFLAATKTFSKSVIPRLLPHVFRDGETHWNPTVNKMRSIVLSNLRDADPLAFSRAAASLPSNPSSAPDPLTSDAVSAEAEAKKCVAEQPPRMRNFGPPRSRLKQDMAGWEPPGAEASSKGSKNPPLTITGVAPWAMNAGGTGPSASAAGTTRDMGGARGSRPLPPVTITGVAPWALGTSAAVPSVGLGGKGPVRVMGGMAPPPPKRPALVATGGVEGSKLAELREEGREGDEDEDHEEEEEEEKPSVNTAGGSARTPRSLAAQAQVRSAHLKLAAPSMEAEGSEVDEGVEVQSEGLNRILEFIDKHKPQSTSQGKSWLEVQMAPSPTLLPELRFHDLVFGQDLGSGAFSTVKYARHIQRGSTRSDWPEYAVKVISTSKIEELGYETSVSREIAVLRILSHPGIARMVSAFRWRDGAYLVLEYASKGDLHSYIVANGSLSDESARFVLGEVIAALRSVHDAGLVFGDLKSENVVLTESGHVKLTDFGACRPHTEQAARVLRGSRHAVRHLRDGDWIRPPHAQRDQRQKRVEYMKVDGDKDRAEEQDSGGEDSEEEDERIEGTLAYLPPEVIRDGQRPDVLTDAWALGCLFTHCLCGKPPVFAQHETEDVRARVVNFALQDGLKTLLAESNLSTEARALIEGLLATEKDRRLTVEAAAFHPFFASHGVDVYKLHNSPPVPLQQGAAAPNPDAAWNRRQFSSIWAPLPGSYSFASSSYSLRVIPETDVEANARFVADGSAVGTPMTGLPPLAKARLPADDHPSLSSMQS